MGLEVEPDVVQRAALAVADGDHEARAGEDHHLADLDRLGAVDVAGGLEHEEQRVAEHLELRALVGVDGVLDGERMQLEPLADRLDDLRAGVVEADPDEAVAARVRAAERGLELDATALPVALVVEAAVDDGGADVLDARVRARRRPRAPSRTPASRRGSGNQDRPSGGIGASLTPLARASRASSRDLDPAAVNLHTPLTRAHLAWRACSLSPRSSTTRRTSARSSSPRARLRRALFGSLPRRACERF